MGLVNKEVQVSLMGNNINYYESKGYIIPRRANIHGIYQVPQGAKITVKIEDLKQYSSALVDVKCDGCGELLQMRWLDYKRYVHKDGKYFCIKCINKLFIDEKKKKINESKLQKSQSFGYWLIKNCPLRQAVSIIMRWDEEKNKCDIRKITYSSTGVDRKGYWFKCPKRIHPSELHNINIFTSKKSSSMRCKACNSIGQYICDTYGKDKLNYYWDWYKNIDKNDEPLNPFTITKNSHKKIWIYCQEHSYHGSYKITPNAFYNNNRCPYCATFHGQVHIYDSLGWLYPEVLNVWSEKNYPKTPYDYTPWSVQKIWWKCLDEKHDDYKRSISASNQANFYCNKCSNEKSESFLQRKVRVYLESLKLGQVLHEYNCTIIAKNPKISNYKGRMPYDNEIIINNKHLICEVHGIQHYSITNFHNLQAKAKNTIAEYELHRIKLHDRYKRIYAKSKDYEYLEIPYWTDNKNEDWKLLINNKLNEILTYKEVS
jgi:hypothetical protein